MARRVTRSGWMGKLVGRRHGLGMLSAPAEIGHTGSHAGLASSTPAPLVLRAAPLRRWSSSGTRSGPRAPAAS
eukprot:scaffold5941_cov269-Prasinococcus_capsulatus_cf.AAC.1